MKKFLSILTACFISSLLSAQVNYYVSATGNDANNGQSESAAKASVEAAYTAATESYIADQTETTYIINVGAGIFETSNLAIKSLGGLSITIKGEGANVTTLQGGATMPSEAKLFASPEVSNSNQQLKIYLEDLKIDNYAFTDETNGAIINMAGPAAKNIHFNATRCSFSNLQSKDGAVIKSNHHAFMTFSQCSFVDIKAINNEGVYPIFNIVRGALTIENCFFARCVRDYTIAGGETTESNDEGIIIKSKPLYNWVANTVNLINNTFVDCGVIKGNDLTIIAQKQSLIHLHNPHEGTKGSGGKIDAVIANNLILGTTLEGLDASNYVDIYVNNTDPDPSTEANNINLTNCTNNVINASAGFPVAGNDINPSYAYTSSEINFTMDGDYPELFTTSTGVNYAKANGTSVFHTGLADVATTIDIAGTTRDAAPCVGAYEAPNGVVTGIEASLKADVALFPIPVSDVLYVKGDVAHISLYNIAGTLVQSSDVFNGSVDVSAMPKGIYSAKCENADGVQVATLRLIKK